MKCLLAPILLLTLLFPTLAFGETWICQYQVHGIQKFLNIKRTLQGFESKGFGSAKMIRPIFSETTERIVLITHGSESVYVTILDKIKSEFIMSGVHTPTLLRRDGRKMDTYRLPFNHGKCEIVD